MKRFFFRAKDRFGKEVKGEVEAQSEYLAAKLVRAKGLVVISIKSARGNPLTIIRNLNGGVGLQVVATFTRQMATMVAAGLTITETLTILRSQSAGTMQRIVVKILADVEGGESLSNAISKYPKAFSPTYIALVKSGEAGGVLDEVLVRLADDLEKQQEFNSKVKGALIYPAIIVIGMIVVAFIMMVFVIPRLLSLYTEFNATLPLPTQILISISNFFTTFWPLVIIFSLIAFWLFRAYAKTPFGRRTIDETIFRIPVFGDLERGIIMTELTRTLSLMVASGVSILEGLSITAGVVGNTIISEAIKDVSHQVEKGFPISYAFARHPEAFPFILSQMVAVGEETGKMDEVLKKLSHIFEIESNEKVKGLTASIEPLIMVFLGVGVGFLVIAVILPIYNLTSSF
jgi:type IV pilus assembly protein PilC